MHFPKLFSIRQVARSFKSYAVRDTRGHRRTCFAYALPELANREVSWSHDGQAYNDKFVLHGPVAEEQITDSAKCTNRRAKANPHKVSTSMKEKVCQSVVERVLCESERALFSKEIWKQGRKYRADFTHQAVKTALWRMTKHGKLKRFDDHHGGWKFAKGYLYALLNSKHDAASRIDSLDDQVTTRSERTFLARVRGGIWMASDLRDATHLPPDSITYMTRKFGRSARVKVSSEGSGYDYRVSAAEDNTAPIEGHGLLPWLRWVNIFGQLLIFDERSFSSWAIREYAEKAGYWLSAEGRRRLAVGKEWEAFSKEFFDACDKNQAWQLRVAEHRQNWKGRSGHEFDHVYTCQLGPNQIGLTLTIIFECKAGFISLSDVDNFLESLVSEPEFRNSVTGGIKVNVLPVMLSGRRAEEAALTKANKIGIRIVLHTSMEDVIAELNGQPRKTFHQILKESGLLPSRRSQNETQK